MSSTTCAASSRVGTRTSALGRASAPAVRSTSGTPKAIVFPEPVGDSARMSTPASASGRTRLWTAKGSWMLRAASACTTGALTPSAPKDLDMVFDSFVGSGFETQETRTPQRRNEKLDLTSAGRRYAAKVARLGRGGGGREPPPPHHVT